MKMNQLKVVLMVGLVAASTAFSFESDKKGALLITMAHLSKSGEGAILGFYDSIDFSHKATAPSVGLLTLDPLEVKNSWVRTTVENRQHKLTPKQLVSFKKRIFEMVGEENLAPQVTFHTKPEILSNFGSGATFPFYLLDDKNDSASRLGLPEGSLAVQDEVEADVNKKRKIGKKTSATIVETSVLIEVGDKKALKRKYDELMGDSESIYGAHFEKFDLRMDIYETPPGREEEEGFEVGSVSGFDIRFHKKQRTGALILPRGGGEVEKVAICDVKDSGEAGTVVYADGRRVQKGKGYSLAIDAEKLLEKVILPKLDLESQDAKDSIVFSVAEESVKQTNVTAYDPESEVPCGPAVIRAKLGKNRAEPTIFYLEDSEDPTVQYRVEIELDEVL